MFQLRAVGGFIIHIFQKPDIGKINCFIPAEIEKVYDYWNGE